MDPQKLEPVLAALRSRAEVVAAILFGSRARGEARPESDVDLGVVVDPAWFESLSAFDKAKAVLSLMAACRRSSRLDLDVVVLNAAHPLAAWDAVHAGRLLWCRSMTEMVDFGRWARGRHEDWLHLHAIEMADVRRRLDVPQP